MEEEISSDDIYKYQASLRERQELLGYCKKISQGLENLDEKSGERAIWELVQNARDMNENCKIRIKLLEDRIVFSHYGKAFDYSSLLALVNQNSSKDDPGADIVGQYGTGFITTHAFNEIVSIQAPYKAMKNSTELKGYVNLNGFQLNRSNRSDIEKAIKEMSEEMKLVDNMHENTPLYSSLDEMAENLRWTSFTYMLTSDQVDSVSNQITSALRLMPIVLVINERIKMVEVENQHTNDHYKIEKTNDVKKVEKINNEENWQIATNSITKTNLQNGEVNTESVRSLFSVDGNDVIILPPFPSSCGKVGSLPTLFLWFPLLGSEHFGVNFIFHSKRFYPVEKRNNILLPENVSSKIEKGQHNESVLKEMMQILFDYYAIQNNNLLQDNNLIPCREMCEINFHSDKEDEVTTKFYTDMQDMWKAVVPTWKVIPTDGGYKSMDNERVKVLHPDFYAKLTEEKRQEYEPTLAAFAKMVKNGEKESYLLPSTDIIAWSDTVNQWNCGRDVDFFITVEDVCMAIQNKSDDLHKFLVFLKESENSSLLEKYALIPNWKGVLRKKAELNYAKFMTSDVYNLVNVLMGDDADKMIDTAYLDITTVGTYEVCDLHKAITNTISEWRKLYLNVNSIDVFLGNQNQFDALLAFCSATLQSEFNNQRGRLMKHIPQLFNKEFKQRHLDKLEEKEYDLYSASFNFLLDFTLLSLSTQEEDWVKNNKEWLFEFLKDYSTSKNKDWLDKLDKYCVIPNQLDRLCVKKDLLKNDIAIDELAEIYKTIFSEDLHEHWVDREFENLFEFEKETVEEIAKKIEDTLENDIKQEDSRNRKYDKILREVILNIIGSEDWKKWFSHIEDKKANYTFKMKDGDVQKSLFSLMDLRDNELKELADLSEDGNMSEMITELKRQKQLKSDNDARFYHLHKIGKHIEDVLRSSIGEENINVDCRENNDAKLIADDIQNGQDIVVKLFVNGEWQDIYYIEVKSKWNFSEPAHMSTNQVRMASLHPSEYSLCCVDLRKHVGQELASLSADDIITCTKVKMDIGSKLKPMMEKILEAEDCSEDVQIKISEYRSNISAKIFEAGVPFSNLLNTIECIAKSKISGIK